MAIGKEVVDAATGKVYRRTLPIDYYENTMDAIEIHPGTPNAYYETNCIKGPDFDFDSAPNVVEIDSYCSRQPHLHLEPDCGYAYIDVLAAKMGMDSFDIRELNCCKESAQSTIPTGYKPDVYCLEEMYKKFSPLKLDTKAMVVAVSAGDFDRAAARTRKRA